MPPSARDLRAQAVQRLQTGLFGIAAVLLVVGLANIINDRARLVEEAGKTAATSAEADAPANSDPLADIGVVPSAVPSEAAATASPSPAVRTTTPNAPR